jgi:LysM repeat protein
LLMLGYPLSGDLSLGGYRSENYAYGMNLTVPAVIEMWLGDDPHTNTMLSPYRSDIGAGVASGSDGTIYYVIDTALRTTSGRPQPEATLYFPNGGGTPGAPGTQPALVSQYIVPVAVATARPDGDVFHKVQYGQTLWSIAIQYGTTIEQIQSYNNLEDTSVYVGWILLVQKNATQPAPVPTATATLPEVVKTPIIPTSTQIIVRTATPTVTTIPTVVSQASQNDHVIVISIIISFIVLMVTLGLWGRKKHGLVE